MGRESEKESGIGMKRAGLATLAENPFLSVLAGGDERQRERKHEGRGRRRGNGRAVRKEKQFKSDYENGKLPKGNESNENEERRSIEN